MSIQADILRARAAERHRLFCADDDARWAYFANPTPETEATADKTRCALLDFEQRQPSHGPIRSGGSRQRGRS